MTVHFIGAGPGAADLLTLRAVRELERADVIVVGHPPAATSIDPTTLRPRTRGTATMAGPALLPMTLGHRQEHRIGNGVLLPWYPACLFLPK